MNGQRTRNEQATASEETTASEQVSGADSEAPRASVRLVSRGSRRAAALGIAALLALGAVVIVPAAQQAHGGSVLVTQIPIGEHSQLGPRLVSDRNEAIAAMQQIRGEHAGITLDEYQAESALIRLHLENAPAGSAGASNQ